MDIYIGNLNYEIDEEKTRKIFEIFGQVTKVILIRDKRSLRSLGYGFVQMPDAIEASRAISELDGRTLAGRKMIVKSAHSKDMRPYVTRYAAGESDTLPQNGKSKKNIKPNSYSKDLTKDGYVKVRFEK